MKKRLSSAFAGGVIAAILMLAVVAGPVAGAGYENLTSYLSLIGDPQIKAIVQKYFDDPAVPESGKNTVYAQLGAAFTAKSELDALKAAQQAALALANSANPDIRRQAAAALSAINLRITALQSGTPATTVRATTVMTTVSTTSTTTTIRPSSPNR